MFRFPIAYKLRSSKGSGIRYRKYKNSLRQCYPLRKPACFTAGFRDTGGNCSDVRGRFQKEGVLIKIDSHYWSIIQRGTEARVRNVPRR